MSKCSFVVLFFAISFSVQSARAEIVVNFIESAPKDRFVFKNEGSCSYESLHVEIDLTESAGRLIFDTTDSGAGVEVFQPFEVRDGEIRLVSTDQVRDGEQVLTVEIKNLTPDSTASFTIDLDDTLPKSELGQIRVSGAEIMNGLVSVSYKEQPVLSAKFGADSAAVVTSPEC